jgi:hypothetical protein
MENQEECQECLEWLESLDKNYIGDDEREYLEENFPKVKFNMLGVTSIVEHGEIKTPVVDYIQSIKYGKSLD